MIDVRSQRIARAAFRQVEARAHQPGADRYLSFARAFPTLIHTSGIAQASAFALAKREEKLQVLEDLALVMNAADSSWQFDDARRLHDIALRQETDVRTYMLLTRHALQSATWIKRYAEALIEKTKASLSDSTNSDVAYDDPSAEDA